jgi:Ca2+-binding RTX toxin-like protein
MAIFTALPNGSKVRATAAADKIYGGTSKDVLFGLGGADLIRAGAGNDTIFGDGKSTFKEVFQAAGQAILALASTVPASSSPLLKSQGLLDGASVWSISNTSSQAVTVTLLNPSDQSQINLTIPARSELFLTTSAGQARALSSNGVVSAPVSASTSPFNGNAEAAELQAGDDTIYAGSGDDWIDAGAGNDAVYGEFGKDILTGGAGADLLNGGSGSDTADYLRSTLGISINLFTGTAAGGDAEGDTLLNIENIRGSGQADTITGNDLSNKINGMAGADTLNGLGGNDWIITGGGYDVIDGGAGTDTVSYEDSWSAVEVNLALGGRYGSASRDSYISIERVVGSKFDDKLSGDGGNNRLTGGAGADSFIFDSQFGYDRVVDFSEDDVIILNGLGFETVADVLDAAVDGALGAIIAVTGHGKITIVGVSASALTESDFILGQLNTILE